MSNFAAFKRYNSNPQRTHVPNAPKYHHLDGKSHGTSVVNQFTDNHSNKLFNENDSRLAFHLCSKRVTNDAAEGNCLYLMDPKNSHSKPGAIFSTEAISEINILKQRELINHPHPLINLNNLPSCYVYANEEVIPDEVRIPEEIFVSMKMTEYSMNLEATLEHRIQDCKQAVWRRNNRIRTAYVDRGGNIMLATAPPVPGVDPSTVFAPIHPRPVSVADKHV